MANFGDFQTGIYLEGMLGGTTPELTTNLARLEEQAAQCGYCLSGIIMSAKALLDRNPRPSRADIVTALDRNLCRCGTHTRIIAAVQKVASMGAPA